MEENKDINKSNKKVIIISISIMLGLVLLLLGIAFAVWFITRSQQSTNIVKALDCLDISLSGNEAIDLSGAFPLTNQEGMDLIPHSFKIINECDIYVSVNIYLAVLNKTDMQSEYVRVSLQEKDNTDDNSNILSSYNITTPTVLENSISYNLESEILLSPNQTIKKDLRVWMNESALFEEVKGKEFYSKIVISANPTLITHLCDLEKNEELLQCKILASNGGRVIIEEKPRPAWPNQNLIATTDEGMFAEPDDDGTSYYFRGTHTLNNNIIFAEHQWKIIRIDGNGNIRMIYNGVCPDNECNINVAHANTTLGATSILRTGTTYTHAWNTTNYNDNKYVGFMYGGANGVASDCRGPIPESGCIVPATKNETNSNAKAQLDLWYQNNILTQGKSITNKISDAFFCNDRRLRSEVGGPATGTGFGDSDTWYAIDQNQRLSNPSLLCGPTNDRFSVNIANGNGALTYPVGLIISDETRFAGGGNSNNNDYYLRTGQTYWIMTPKSYYLPSLGAIVQYFSSTGNLHSGYLVSNAHGLRPVIALKGNLPVTGDGSTTYPYVPYACGDINLDGKVDNDDVTILQQYIVKWPGVTVPLRLADVDGDGKVDMTDDIFLQRHIAGMAGYEKLSCK